MNTHRYPERGKAHRNERLVGDGPGKPPNMPFGAGRGRGQKVEIVRGWAPARG